MDAKAPSYLEDFLDQIEVLPTQIKGKFVEMRDMEERLKSLMDEADKAAAETVRKSTSKGTSNEGLKKSYQDVIALQGKAIANAETKLQTAEVAFGVVDGVIHELDDRLREFEMQLRKEGRWPASTSDKPPRGSATPAGSPAPPAAVGPSTRGAGGGGHQKTTRRAAAGARAAVAAAGGTSSRKQEKKEAEMQFAVIEDMVPDPDEPTYCYCNQISYGEMVMCESDDCPHNQWFHFTCVGLTEAPSGSWQCPECKKKNQKRRKADS